MFQRFSNLVNQAVEVVVSQTKSKKETLLDHWYFVASYFDGSREPASHIDETNISFHLVSIIKYIKEEEQEQEEREQGLTGPCLEELLYRKMPDQLVDWAQQDKPRGMLLQVLRSFCLLISNVHHRLLPEATVRLPLERLIIISHELKEHEDLVKIKYELMKLINVLFRRFRLNPALINLFIIEPRQMSPSKTDLLEIEGIPLLECCNDYVTSLDAETARLARESMEIVLNLVFDDLRLTKYIQVKYPVFEGWSNVLEEWYKMLPVRSSKMNDLEETNDGERKLKLKQGRSVSPLRSSTMEAIIPLFFDLWAFYNNIVEMAAKSEAAKGELRAVMIEYLLEKLVKNALLPSMQSQQSDEHIVAHYDYVSEMIVDVKTAEVLHGLINILFGEDNDSSALLAKQLVSKNEDIAIASLRFINSLLATYDEVVFEKLIFPDIDPSATNQEIDFQTHQKVIEDLMWLGVAEMEVASIKNGDPPSPSAGCDSYFIDAQDHYYRILPKINEWKGDSGDRELSSINFMDILMLQLSQFFSNSPQKNLLITQILTNIASTPHTGITHWFFQEKNDADGQSPVENQRFFLDTIYQLKAEAEKFAAEIPSFQEKYQIIRKHCGDDMLLILQNLSNSKESETVQELESILTVNEAEENLEDSLENLILTSEDNSKMPPPLSVFLPAYIILAEFCKEISTTLLVVDRTASLKAQLSRIHK